MPKTLDRRYLDIPRFFDRSFYSIAVEKFLEKYSTHEDVLSIYLFGQVSVEGISDLDFIVVLKERSSRPLNREYSVMAFDDDLRYIYNNTQPFLMNEEVFKNFQKIFPTNDLRLIYGKEIERNEIDEAILPLYNILILIDICNYFYPQIFLSQMYSKQMDVRYSLLILNSLKFPLVLFMNLCGDTYDDWFKFMNAVNKLRKDWFSNDDSERYEHLCDALREASRVSLDLVERLDSYIEANLWSCTSRETSCELKMIGKHFISPFDKNWVLDEVTKSLRSGCWSSFSPLRFYYPLLIYSSERGIVSEYLKANLPKEEISFCLKDERVVDCMKDRIGLMNKHVSFYKDTGVKINMVHKYYGYDPLASNRMLFRPLNRIYTLIRKLRSGAAARR